MGAKRKTSSGGGGPPKKAALCDLHVPVDALLKEHVKAFDQWLILAVFLINYVLLFCYDALSTTSSGITASD